MKILKLKDINVLRTDEKIPEVPELVAPYLALEAYSAEGNYFRIIIDQDSNSNTGAGVAYLNALCIEKREGESWSEVYNSGMKQYRGAYNYEIDNWDLSLTSPAILKETVEGVVYGLRTGVGNVKIFSFEIGQSPELLAVFNTREYEATKERIDLLQKVIDDAEAFRSYVVKSLGHRWYTASMIGAHEQKCSIFDANGNELMKKRSDSDEASIVVLLADHADRDYDAISDKYQLFIWVKGKGFVATEIMWTGLHHPGGKFYRIGIGMKSFVISRGSNSVNLNVTVGNRSQQWEKTHEYRVEWSGDELKKT